MTEDKVIREDMARDTAERHLLNKIRELFEADDHTRIEIHMRPNGQVSEISFWRPGTTPGTGGGSSFMREVADVYALALFCACEEVLAAHTLTAESDESGWRQDSDAMLERVIAELNKANEQSQ
jgi:hypothetical protein